jgi:glycosyl transferase family 87
MSTSILNEITNPIERRLNRPYIQFICVLVLTIYIGVLTISFITNVRGRTIFGPYLGADFGAFYIAGRIFNTHPPDRIYDPILHDRLYQEQFPDAPDQSGLPYVNAPFFILPFIVLARLPYSWAYFLWLVLSVVLYVTAFLLLWRTLKEIPRDAWLVASLLSLSFMPFLVECLAGGQTSAVGFFCLTLAIISERRGHYVLSGLALSLCTYKPTLLLLILPMLLITRRYQTIPGFVAGCGVLAFISVLIVGWQGCLAYINNLLFFANASTSTVSGLRSWKYVDINSFFRPLLENFPYLRWTLTGAVFLIVLPFLFRLWWNTDRRRSDDQSFTWALTITWTLVLNVYLGIYDTTLVVLSILLMTDVFYRRQGRDQWLTSTAYKLILLLLYLVPWFTQPIARFSGIQLYTLVLVLLGLYQVVQFRRLTGSDAAISL